jgi:gas vesicle protein
MGDGYDRLYDGNGGSNNGGGSFVIGVLAGAAVGAGLALLFAPLAGAALRKQIARQAGDVAKAATDTAQDGYRRATETANDWADRGKDAIGKAREVVAKGADEVAAAARRG